VAWAQSSPSGAPWEGVIGDLWKAPVQRQSLLLEVDVAGAVEAFVPVDELFVSLFVSLDVALLESLFVSLDVLDVLVVLLALEE